MFDIDLEHCPYCGGPLTIIAAIRDIFFSAIFFPGLQSELPADGGERGGRGRASWRAIDAFQEAHRAEPADVEIVNNLGYAYLVNNDLDSAERYVLTQLLCSLEGPRDGAILGRFIPKKDKFRLL